MTAQVVGTAAVAVDPGHQRHGPQRQGRRQRLADHLDGQVEQRALVAGRRATHDPYAMADVEGRVADSHGSATAGWHGHQALAQPRDRTDALGDEPLGESQIEIRPGLQNEAGSGLHGDGPDAHREIEEIGAGRPVGNGTCRSPAFQAHVP